MVCLLLVLVVRMRMPMRMRCRVANIPPVFAFDERFFYRLGGCVLFCFPPPTDTNKVPCLSSLRVLNTHAVCMYIQDTSCSESLGCVVSFVVVFVLFFVRSFRDARESLRVSAFMFVVQVRRVIHPPLERPPPPLLLVFCSPCWLALLLSAAPTLLYLVPPCVWLVLKQPPHALPFIVRPPAQTIPCRGAAFPSDPPFPSFVAESGGGDESQEQDIWCPQGEEDPLEIIYEDD